MSNHPFIVDNTIPGLGASDLARLMGNGYVSGQTRPKTRRSLKGLLRKLAGFRSSARL